MKVFGIDPGYDRVGWAILDQTASGYELLACGLISTTKKDDLFQRLQSIDATLRSLISQYLPEVVAVEKLYFSVNTKTAMDVAQARGVTVIAALSQGARLLEYSPSQVKSIVAGDGRADKKSMEKLVRIQIKNVPLTSIDDTIDAIAIALCPLLIKY